MAFGLSAGAVGLIGAGAGLLGGVMNSKAAGRASDQQAQSGRESNALARQQYDQTRADNAGVRRRGDAAGNRLSYLMGTSQEGQGGMNAAPTIDAAWASLDRQHMERFGTPAPRGPIQEQQAQNELQGLMSQYQASNQNAMMPQNDPAYGSLSRNFSAGDMSSDPQYAQLRPQIDAALQRSSKFETSPGYQFRMDEGLKATTNNQNAASGSYSGATLKALARFGQDTASQEYGNWMNQSNADRNFAAGQGQDAFNRFTGNQDRTYNRLAGIAGSGQTATNNVNSAGAAYAQNAGNTLQGIGNAQAAGTVGSANAYTNAAQQGFNNYQQNSLMNMFQNRNNNSLYPSPNGNASSNSNDSNVYYANRVGMN